MSEMKEQKNSGREKQNSGFRLAIPFFVVLGILTVVSFCIPLRPTRSMLEKRELKQFPEFSVEALLSGTYFDEISTWYSDTFPGRERWIALSARISSLHGRSAITIQGELPKENMTQEVPDAPREPVTLPEETGEAEETEETAPEETTPWGGVRVAEEKEIDLGAVIQIGDTAFHYQGFSREESEHYARILSKLAEKGKERGTRVVSAPSPTAVGIMVEKSYLEALHCADQDRLIQYMHSCLSEDVIPVDTYAALIDHNDEYLYFRTDHHWTALGAYYSYRAICEALGYEPAELDTFEVWDQGEFSGSLAYQCARPMQLRNDTVYAYIPKGKITHVVYDNTGWGTERPLLQDMRQRELNTKYLTFIWSDNPLSVITNDSLPDAPSCILVKDSFGNCLAPFLTQNYHKVYVVDYRKFYLTNLNALAEHCGVKDIIFAPYVTATQSVDGNQMMEGLSGAF